jgi:hypothetical protein
MVQFPNFRDDEENIFMRDGSEEVNFNLICLPAADQSDMTTFIEARSGEGRDLMLKRVNA